MSLHRSAVVIALLLAGCGGGGQTSQLAQTAASDVALTTAKLRTYCAACHAVGNLKFIRSDDNAEVWRYIVHERTPTSGRLWVDAIADVLNWPSDKAPPFDEVMDPPNNRDWMPKGAKRLSLADDKTNGVLTRRIMIETLRAHGE